MSNMDVLSPSSPSNPTSSAVGEVPRISTEELAKMLHSEGMPSPTSSSSPVPAVAGLTEQLKEKKVVVVPLSPKKT